MSYNDSPGSPGRDEIYARTMSRAGEIAAADRRRHRLLVTLPAAALVIALSGGVLAAVLSTGGPRPGKQHAAGGGPASSSTTTPSAVVNPNLQRYGKFVPASFTAVSLDHWWVLGTYPCSTGKRCGAVLETRNGGQSFRRSPAPYEPVSYTAASYTAQVRYATSTDGFVFGPRLYSTTDDGAQWSKAALPGKVTDVEAAEGKAFALSCTDKACSLYSELIGSTSWHRVALPRSLSVGSTLSVSRNRVVITNGFSQRSPVFFLLSTDGGQRFVTRSSPCVPGLAGKVYAASNQSGVLWAACPTGMEGAPYLSIDNGVHWREATKSTAVLKSCLNVSRGPCMPMFSNSLTVAPLTASKALAWPMGDGTGLVLTSDGGHAYEKVFNGPKSGLLTWAGFSDPQRAYAIYTTASASTGALIESVDGGRHWKRVVFSR